MNETRRWAQRPQRPPTSEQDAARPTSYAVVDVSDTTPAHREPAIALSSHLKGRELRGRYRLDEVIATGGMAQVWSGRDLELVRPVALKVLHSHLAADDNFVTRFRREALAAARLNHRGIVAIYDTVSEGQVEAIVMELVPGQSLRRELDERTTLPPDEAALVVAEVAAALQNAHEAGLVHRDVKPANILLHADDGRVMVADFGIAKAADGVDLTRTGALIGTAKYIAPEQVSGEKADAQSDVYALGVVLYELLTGRVPLEGDSDMATAIAKVKKDPLLPRQINADIPPEIEEITMRALAKDPKDRYKAAYELRAALLATQPETGDDADRLDPRPRRRPADTRSTDRPWLVPVILLATFVVTLGILGVMVGRAGILS